MAWYDSEWKHRKKITIPSSEIGSGLTDFPVYLDLSSLGSHFFDNARSDGADIKITENDGTTELPFELVGIGISDNLNISPSGGFHGGGYGSVYDVKHDIHINSMVIDADGTGSLTVEFIPITSVGDDISAVTPTVSKTVTVGSTGEQTIMIDEDLPAGRYWVGQDDLSLMRTDADVNASSEGGVVGYLSSQSMTGTANPRTYYFFDWDFDVDPGFGELHFKTDLSSSSDNEFYIYYGNSSPEYSYEGITLGVAEMRLGFVRNTWGGSGNTGELGLYAHEGYGDALVGYDEVKTIGDLNNGVALAEALGSSVTGYIMWSSANVHTRFSSNPPNSNNADHFIGVIYDGGQWKYDDNSENFRSFTPTSSDILIAKAEWGTSSGIDWLSPIIAGQVISDVWEDSYGGVYHLDTISSTYTHRDSTKNSNYGNSSGGQADVYNPAAGKVGRAMMFDGDNDDIGLANDGFGSTNSLKIDSTPVVVSAWAKRSSTDVGRIFASDEWTSGNYTGYHLLFRASSADGFQVSWGNDTGTGPSGRSSNSVSMATDSYEWYHIVGIITSWSSAPDIYVNGIKQSVSSTGSATTVEHTSAAAHLGSDGNSQHLAGAIDEVRVRSSLISEDWVFAEYANQSDPDNFYSVSSEETIGLKVYDGTEWIDAPVKYYDGSEWKSTSVKYYDGSEWLS